MADIMVHHFPTSLQVEMAALQHQVTTATDQATRAQGEARAAEAEASDLRQRLERITQVESDNGTVSGESSIGQWWWT
jgi:hypothetical protein